MRLHHIPIGTGRLLGVQVHPIRPCKGGSALLVPTCTGEQGRAAKDQEGEGAAVVRDLAKDSHWQVVLETQGKVCAHLRWIWWYRWMDAPESLECGAVDQGLINTNDNNYKTI